MNSEKILSFLVQDILDFAQLESGRFRKNSYNFNLEKIIREVLDIQEYKAQSLGISLVVSFTNFEKL